MSAKPLVSRAGQGSGQLSRDCVMGLKAAGQLCQLWLWPSLNVEQLQTHGYSSVATTVQDCRDRSTQSRC